MSEIQVQVVEGRAWEPAKMFTPGAPVGPLSLGSAAEWVIDGQDVGPIHAYLYFDGTVLMAATAPPYVTTVNGAPIGGDWVPLPSPCEMFIGGARIQVHPPGGTFEDVATNALPSSEIEEDMATGFLDRSGAPVAPGAPVHRPPGPTDRRAPIEDESTKFLPIEQMRKGAEGGPAPAPQPGGQPAVVLAPEALRPDPSKIAMTIAPGVIPTPQIEPPPSTIQQPLQPRPPAAPGGFAAAWKEASPPRKLTYILLPIALIAFALTMLDDDPPPNKGTKTGGKTAGSTSASASAAPPPPPPLGSLPQLPQGPLLPPPTRPEPPKKRFPVPKNPPSSLERKAVDALISGNYKEASALYEQLAQQHPETPIYKEALRVLKEKQAEHK